jgi:hypothetical protein
VLYYITIFHKNLLHTKYTKLVYIYIYHTLSLPCLSRQFVLKFCQIGRNYNISLNLEKEGRLRISLYP